MSDHRAWFFSRLWRARGAAYVEYAVAVGAVGLAASAGARTFGHSVEQALGREAACVVSLGAGKSCDEPGTAPGTTPAPGRRLSEVDSSASGGATGGTLKTMSIPSSASSGVTPAELQSMSTSHSFPSVVVQAETAQRQAGKSDAARLMNAAGVPSETQAVFQSELMVEQDTPSMRAAGGPGLPIGRDASKDPEMHNGRWQYYYEHDKTWHDADGSMNVGPWNDNVAMLSQYGGMSLPMKGGSASKWGAPGFDPQKVDWKKLEDDYGPNVSDAKLEELLVYKQKMVSTLGPSVYMAARRKGTSIIADNGRGGYGLKYQDEDVKQWIAGQSSLAVDFLKNPSKLTDGRRYRIDYPWI
jgi:Flp pilus assembly pilin Flp